MSFSLRTGKQQILEWFTLHESSIKTILDIGAGSGTYINLIKYANQICVNSYWIGIEIWSPYIELYNLYNLYDKIINQDVRTLNWDNVPNIDVTIAGDVLEHMTKEEAIILVDKILQKSKYLVISIPICHMPQTSEDYSNPYEAHVKDNWSHTEVIETWTNYIVNFFVRGKKSKIGIYWLTNENIN